MAETLDQQLIGNSASALEVGPGITETTLAMAWPAGMLESLGAKQVFLNINNVTGEQAAPTFGVYLNLPANAQSGSYPELNAGNMELFGLAGASQSHGAGRSFKFNITEIIKLLVANNNWDAQKLKLTFIPGFWDSAVPQVKIGQVSLHLE